MSSYLRLSLLALTIASTLLSCTWFDEDLYQGASSMVADRCETAPEIVLAEGSSALFTIDTTGGFSDVIGETCSNLSVGGSDAFFSFTAAENERWHVHIRGQAGTGDATNPALHIRQIVSGSCGDPRQCITGTDSCADTNEHLSFVAPAAGTYVVGIDSRDSGGATYQVEVYRPLCGNDIPEHSEPCDGVANCDECRWVVTANEEETNDEQLSANVIDGDRSGRTVTGAVGASCDDDWFVFDVGSGESDLTVTVTAQGEACDDAPWDASLIDPNGDTRAMALGGCNPLTVSSPEEGEWYVRIRPNAMGISDTRPHNYQVAL